MFGIDPCHARSVVCSLLLVWFWGCGGSSDSGDVDEIVDVEVPIEIDTSQDIQEEQRGPQLVGVLPHDFPEDVPLYLPASLIDFGGGSGGRTVTLLTSHELSRVRPAYEELLRGAGWSVRTADRGTELRKGQRLVRLRFLEGGPGSTYLLEY